MDLEEGREMYFLVISALPLALMLPACEKTVVLL